MIPHGYNIYICLFPHCYLIGRNPVHENLTVTGCITTRESNNSPVDFEKDGKRVLIKEKLKDKLLGQLGITLKERNKTKY